MITIVDYGMGNIQSVVNAFEAIGCPITRADNPEKLKGAKKIVLPGVGAFGEGIGVLRKGGFEKVLNDLVIGDKIPFLGICLGMQLLASTGQEHGSYKGLNWIPGKVIRFDFSAKSFYIPHVGWNDIEIKEESTLFPSKDYSPDFYFVHSYHFVSESDEFATSWCNYGIRFAASVQKDNIFGIQFHPEKSHKEGLDLLQRFADL